MVRHERMNDDAILMLGHTLRRVINRLIKTVPRERADLRKSLHVPQRGPRRDHRGKNCRIWRDHKIFAQTTFQTETRHAERTVLIIELQIARVVR
jgi:hypothetical protein